MSVNKLAIFSVLRSCGEKIVEKIKSFLSRFRSRARLVSEAREELRQRFMQEPEEKVVTPQTEVFENKVVDLMNNTFHGQHPGQYLLGITDIEKREEAVISFAKELAAIYGLSELHFECEAEEASYCGYYQDKYRKLFINKSFLAVQDPLVLLDVIDTIIHETRHAVQMAAMRGHNPMEFDEETIKNWVRNWTNYIRPENDPKGYSEQPIEVDARAAAQTIIHQYLERNELQA